MNQAKSKALNITMPHDMATQLQQTFPFTWVNRFLKYLGIQLAKTHTDLFGANYTPVLTKLSSLLTDWSKLHISWIGEIMAVKMSLLPKLLYLFRVLPTSKESYNGIYSTSIGDKRNLDYRERHFFNPGGLGIPHLLHYFHAAQAATLTKYSAHTDTPLWVSIEAADSHPLRIDNLLWLPPTARR